MKHNYIKKHPTTPISRTSPTISTTAVAGSTKDPLLTSSFYKNWDSKSTFFFLAAFALFSFSLVTYLPATAGKVHPTLGFDKVIIWGHKLHSHTHSYIHAAFYKTFKYMGYDTYWIDNYDMHTLETRNALFITEGQVDQHIPLDATSYYILHNCTSPKYAPLFQENRCIILQVYTHDCLSRNVTKIEECIYADYGNKVIYMPWATDLLPEEIDAIKANMHTKRRDTVVNWVGTIGGGYFGNITQVNNFKRACSEKRIPFHQLTHLNDEETISAIQKSYIAPALQGAWQCEKGYIPCRIFKNISYGQLGVTNSETVYKLFNKKIVYNSDTYQLFLDAQKKLANLNPQEIYELMDFVRDNHTYINRIDTLLDFLEKAQN
jgi:hypothetical protein